MSHPTAPPPPEPEREPELAAGSAVRPADDPALDEQSGDAPQDAWGTDNAPVLGFLGPVLVVFIAVVVAILGTMVHRVTHGAIPTGILLALASAALGAVCARAMAGRVGAVVYIAALFATILILTYAGRGGDVLLADDGVSMGWMIGGPMISLLGLLNSRFLYGRPATNARQPRNRRGSERGEVRDGAGSDATSDRTATEP